MVGNNNNITPFREISFSLIFFRLFLFERRKKKKHCTRSWIIHSQRLKFMFFFFEFLLIMVRKVSSKAHWFIWTEKLWNFEIIIWFNYIYTGCYTVRSVHVPKIMIEFKNVLFSYNVHAEVSCSTSCTHRIAIRNIDLCTMLRVLSKCTYFRRNFKIKDHSNSVCL